MTNYARLSYGSKGHNWSLSPSCDFCAFSRLFQGFMNTNCVRVKRAPYEPFLAIYAAAVVQRGVSIAAKRRKNHKK